MDRFVGVAWREPAEPETPTVLADAMRAGKHLYDAFPPAATGGNIVIDNRSKRVRVRLYRAGKNNEPEAVERAGDYTPGPTGISEAVASYTKQVLEDWHNGD